MHAFQVLGVVASFSLASLVVGCGGSVDSSGASEAVCAAGTTQACLGPGQCAGAQQCLSDGSAYGSCDCGDSPGGAGGTGGTGGEGGATDGTGAIGGTGGMGGEPPTVIDEPGPGKQPPDAPGETGIGPTEDVAWAIDALFLGESDWAGNPSVDAWQDYGYNIDGLLSTKLGANHCKPVVGASKASVQTDGPGGVDNSFGKNITPFISTLQPDPSLEFTKAIADGDGTTMIRIRELSAAANQRDLWAAVYNGARLENPQWDGKDVWDVYDSSFHNGDSDKPRVVFPNSHVNGHAWVSGARGTVTMPSFMQGVVMNLEIRNARFTMEMDAARTRVLRGIISGVLDTEAYIEELHSVAGGFDESLCDGSLFDSIADQIRQASDIMADGTNGNPDATCDGISIGIGFTAKRVIVGEAVAMPPAPEDPCN